MPQDLYDGFVACFFVDVWLRFSNVTSRFNRLPRCTFYLSLWKHQSSNATLKYVMALSCFLAASGFGSIIDTAATRSVTAQTC
ncbi:hypothetical protein [Sodalis endosymbiont of Henestaris halophilus]|uniref:hypothetical protein n=1 Tax=Sodalis endosymbiont of Henestaris halophilus TaxID=1929246 RepID=UPI0012FD2DC7|nr:hypothetical protein [Sodalis endosymbiont of Henestaris halophilus]